MPESLNARPVASLLRITLVTLAATLSSCHVFVEQAEKNLQASPSPGLALSSAVNAPIRRFTPSTERLKFELDPASTGTIDLAIDHDSWPLAAPHASARSKATSRQPFEPPGPGNAA